MVGWEMGVQCCVVESEREMSLVAESAGDDNNALARLELASKLYSAKPTKKKLKHRGKTKTSQYQKFAHHMFLQKTGKKEFNRTKPRQPTAMT